MVISCRGPESQTHTGAPLKSSTPTGVYVSAIDVGTRFTVRLDDSGDYLVRTESTESLPPLESQSQRGRWAWNEQRQEFLLTPDANNGGFGFEFRRLRVDERETDTLQWIPLHGVGASAGAIDYVRLKRQKG